MLAVFALPLLAYWAYAAWINPSHNYYTVDTEFPYFLNSLSVFKGGNYTYADHPGTPLEEIGTAILAVSYAMRGQTAADFVTYELQNPGRFLDAAHSLLMLTNIACLIGLFMAARGNGGRDYALAAGGIAVMYFAIHPSSLEASTV